MGSVPPGGAAGPDLPAAGTGIVAAITAAGWAGDAA
jgi:hypothetical protein